MVGEVELAIVTLDQMLSYIYVQCAEHCSCRVAGLSATGVCIGTENEQRDSGKNWSQPQFAFYLDRQGSSCTLAAHIADYNIPMLLKRYRP